MTSGRLFEHFIRTDFTWSDYNHIIINQQTQIKQHLINFLDFVHVFTLRLLKFFSVSTGNPPLVVSRGGFSGLFPDSSELAYKWSGLLSLPNSSYWCDLQLTKDGAGICFPDLILQEKTDIATVFPNKNSTYTVNGVSVQGWFSLDFTRRDLSNITLTQNIVYRPELFNNIWTILTVQEVVKLRTGQGLWLNIQHAAFFSQNKLSMRNFTLSLLRTAIVDYISSPEVSFLSSIVARKPTRTKLVFRFLEKDGIEPSTNQTYGTLLGNLTFIKTFASGILVPKGYIWPLDTDQYLLPSTSLVSDAHTAGLQVFAADFAHDINFIPYNFSYDPVLEYLSFIDNGIFSVDGVLSDFPIISSAAIDCFSHIGKNASEQEKPLVITLGGSSGDFASCTDLAYQKAIMDGADIIDCPVQMTKDGIPICLTNIDLTMTSDASSTMTNLITNIEEIGLQDGIPTFNVTWRDIQKLKPFLASPYQGASLFRNPRYRDAGNFMTLSDFLNVAESSSNGSGVLIVIGYAPYLAQKQGIDVIGAVLNTLASSSYTKTSKRVLIQSSSSSVLTKIKENNTSYELVYRIENPISDADNSSIMNIKRFANAVVIGKSSVFPDVQLYLTGMTVVVQKMHAFGLNVYVRTFRNEFVSQVGDFFSDPTVEINTYTLVGEIDGVITEFPATAVRYKHNRCLKMGTKLPPYMSPIVPGNLKQLIPPKNMPSDAPPSPVLSEADVAEPPFPPVTVTNPPPPPPGNTSNPRQNGQPRMVARTILVSCIAVFSTVLALF
ncbi:glycerophosphodiester phosphodiesterase GDPDL3-like [Impatiens glandulifera]|uniref:glycerophosphodiester phosphodiesterase GDPDL3-like n=1 Tax=Impatiens glandulifera TaxID=253017 RepID=UPI001FB06B8A|nr:glycerophosphodiester phosphodiesterase GDPDL3-like [Impatiens glandulifera]